MKIQNKYNLILTCWLNYDINVVNPFFNSFLNCFNKSDYNSTDIIVFYKNVRIEHINEILNLNNKIKFIKIEENFDNINICTYRHKLYYEYLNNIDDKYTNVLLADIRDIIFQNDKIFDNSDINNNILVFSEDKLYSNIYNPQSLQKWESICYNLAFDKKSIEYKTLMNSEYYCAGTIAGDTNLIKQFCYDIYNTCLEKCKNKKHVLKQFAIDTCIFNYLINVQNYPNIIKRNNHSDEILTFSRINNFNNLKYDKDNNILNDNDIPFSVLHFNGKMIYPDKIIKKYNIKPYKQSSLNNHNNNSVKNSSNKTIIQPTMNFRNPHAIHNMPKKLLRPLNNSRMFRNK